MSQKSKIEVVGSENYAAVVVRVEQLYDLDGLDRLKGLRVLGFQALVSKDVALGDLMVVFVAGSQLAPEFAAANNLYRHQNLNSDTTKAGYFEDNARVKAIKMRGNQSDAFAIQVSALELVLGYVPELLPGQQFDTIDGHEFCHKFVLKTRGKGLNGENGGTVSAKLVPDELFPEHYDTAQYNRNRDRYAPDDYVVVTQKIHGTSVRIGNVPVKRKLTLREKLARFFGVKVQEFENSFVVGSRRVTKSVNGQTKPGAHYYADDLWSSAAAHLKESIPPGFIVYAEIVGWTAGGAAIQKGYTYHLTPNNSETYVYRVTSINENGDQFDLGWHDVEKFCFLNGLKTVPVLWSGHHAIFEVVSETFIDQRFFPTFPNAIALSDPKSVDEGVCIRSQNGVVTKHKSPIFLGHESALMDKETVDIEEEQAAE